MKRGRHLLWFVFFSILSPSPPPAEQKVSCPEKTIRNQFFFLPFFLSTFHDVNVVNPTLNIGHNHPFTRARAISLNLVISPSSSHRLEEKMLLLLTRNVFFNLIKIRHAASRKKKRNHKVEKVRKGNEWNSRNRRASLARANKLTARHLRHLAGLLFISFLPPGFPLSYTARRCRRSLVVAAGCWLPPSFYLDALRWRRVETRIKYDEFLPLATLDTTATTVSRTSRADSKVEIEFQSCFCLSVAVVITILLRHCYVVVCSKSLKSLFLTEHTRVSAATQQIGDESHAFHAKSINLCAVKLEINRVELKVWTMARNIVDKYPSLISIPSHSRWWAINRPFVQFNCWALSQCLLVACVTVVTSQRQQNSQ